MSIILETINKNAKLSGKEASQLDKELKKALSSLLDKALMHGYQMNKENIQGALNMVRRTFVTNI